MYGHMNNVQYIHYVDTVTNHFLITHCFLQPASRTSLDPIALAVSTKVTYISQLGFPSPVLIGMSIIKLGRSSVVYRVGIFEAEVEGGPESMSQTEQVELERKWKVKSGAKAACYADFTHVYVDPITRKSVEMLKNVREAMEKVKIDESQEEIKPML